MGEKEWAERFGCDLDDLLLAGKPTDCQGTPCEYRESLDLAHRLLAIDFYTCDTTLQQRLYHRLVGHPRQNVHFQRKESSVRILTLHRLPGLAVAMLVVIALLTAALVWPAVPRAVAQGIAYAVQTLTVGPNTSVSRTSYDASTLPAQVMSSRTPVPFQGPVWGIKTVVGNFGGSVLPGQDATVRKFKSIEEAAPLIPFPLRMPGYLPDHYHLSEVAVTPARQVFLFYEGQTGEIVIAEQLVGTTKEQTTRMSDSEQTKSVTISKVKVVTNNAVTSVDLNGYPAAWVEGGGLRWEASNVSYVVGGTNLGQAEAMRIAESLR